MLALLFLIQAQLAAPSQADAPVSVVLDTDIGGDIDDTWALAMLLGCPQVDLKLIVTAFGDTEAKTRLVAKMLDMVGRMDIPIGTGKKTDDDELNQAKWLGDYSLDGYGGTVHRDGVQAMVDAINAAEKPVTLVVIGPQTNIAAALERDPSITTKARIVTMAGSIRIGYNGNPQPQTEWNVKCDIPAAKAVLSAPWDIAMDPLDICGALRLSGEHYDEVRASESPLARVVMENYDMWTNRHNHDKQSSSILFDTVAAYMAFDESLCEMETVKISIDDEGNTKPDENGKPVRCAVGWKDNTAEDAFKGLLVKALTVAPGGQSRE